MQIIYTINIYKLVSLYCANFEWRLIIDSCMNEKKCFRISCKEIKIYFKKFSCNFTPMVYNCNRLVWDSGVALDWNTSSHRTDADFFEEEHQSHTWLVCSSKINTYSVLKATLIFNSLWSIFMFENFMFCYTTYYTMYIMNSDSPLGFTLNLFVFSITSRFLDFSYFTFIHFNWILRIVVFLYEWTSFFKKCKFFKLDLET